jgi:hypothetical protein
MKVLEEEQRQDRKDRGDDRRHLGSTTDVGVESGARNTGISRATLLGDINSALRTDSW